MLALNMIPAGYLFKQVKPCSECDWLKKPTLLQIYSVCNCISEDFADYINEWKHNSFWLFDDPKIMQEIAVKRGVDLRSCELFYYEVYEKKFDQVEKLWKDITPEASFPLNVIRPSSPKLCGFDVCTYMNGVEHSPLSCNALADELDVNSYCLFDDFGAALNCIDNGKFDWSESGDLHIFAVYPAA
jgi:hypothetical protein